MLKSYRQKCGQDRNMDVDYIKIREAFQKNDKTYGKFYILRGVREGHFPYARLENFKG